ncbi:ATP-dependent nuclease [Bradyrhizobium symbiodeficiens]|uniref:ATP-dependent nuclease n=1 Tax=Bradyrhizobium symbiodeficiens TaxID=1404367 RepID=UPI00140FB053|nr:ATP-binding protein [Bradyrhizobium symbiodeficiens]QIP00304.1 ATP-binding protein [Bradyrhizobium symbiodeficiens]
MFKKVRFRNFKSLRDFTIHLRAMNVLVGPNNAGKSTVLDAFRIIMAAHSFASRRLQQTIHVNHETIAGYDIPPSLIPVSLTNIHSDYQTDQETSLTFTLDNGNQLRLQFYDNSRCIMTLDAQQRTVTTAQFKKNFPVNVYSIPTLGPLEEVEELLTDQYVTQSIGTRRAHRMFRNIWFRWKKEFPVFQKMVEDTWEGMTISRPELDLSYPPKFSMFCTEGRVDRELCWAGFGFQVWLQLLTHITNAETADILVVDEPEIYLHPDLQHKLFQILRSTKKQIILATHSAEIINEAEHDDVIVVNKVRRSATRITDVDGLQEALFSIGSGQNVHLSRLSRGRKLLFLEGNDFRILRRFAAQLGLRELANDVDITVVPIGGFSQRQKIQNAAWTFEKVLKAEIAISAVLDRDYRCKEETEELIREARTTTPHFHVLAGKEIENYLLVAPAILRAISERLKEQGSKNSFSREELDAVISSTADETKSQVLSQKISNRMRYFDHRTSKDPATVASEAISLVDSDWSALATRLLVIPGKQAFAGINTHLQRELGISITSTQIIRHMKMEEVHTDLRQILLDLNEFAKADRPTKSAA